VRDRFVEEGTYTLDTTKMPKTIDLAIKKGPGADKRQLGLYKVEKDDLRLAFASPGRAKRPERFETKPEDDDPEGFSLTLKRKVETQDGK
jgi:uncharacterized protein (TIGR03067 family)